MPPENPDYVVSCKTCLVIVQSGDEPPEDGQRTLVMYADKNCPRANCPHKTANQTSSDDKIPATRGELKSLAARLAAVEGKTNDKPAVSR
jgi:hypothetical protein